MNQQTFNPADVPITYTLNFHQVNVILKGMAKLPREETDGFYEQVKAHALQTLQTAEAAHNEAAEKAAADAAKQAEAAKQSEVVDAIAKNLGVEKQQGPAA